MKRTFYILLGLVLLVHSCSSQSQSRQQFHSKEFNWTLSIPEGFENVEPEEWGRIQDQGSAAVEKTYGEEIKARPSTIFVFKSDDANYFESNHQPFDTDKVGDYLTVCKEVNKLLYQTFVSQMPGVKVDTTASTERIDDLLFQKFKVVVNYPNMTLTTYLFTRLFGKREFSVNIMYVDKAKGEKMLAAWRASTFDQ